MGKFRKVALCKVFCDKLHRGHVYAHLLLHPEERLPSVVEATVGELDPNNLPRVNGKLVNANLARMVNFAWRE